MRHNKMTDDLRTAETDIRQLAARIDIGMANSAKNKGDRYEREAKDYLIAMAPDLVCELPMRMLGAGRKDDIGDIRVFDDTAIQVRALANMGQAVRSSAHDAVIQAGNGRMPYALGMVPVQGARKEKVRWLACVAPDQWPGGFPASVAEFSIISKALPWLGDDKGPEGYRPWSRVDRVCTLNGPGKPVLIAPMESWLEAYREERNK